MDRLSVLGVVTNNMPLFITIITLDRKGATRRTPWGIRKRGWCTRTRGRSRKTIRGARRVYHARCGGRRSSWLKIVSGSLWLVLTAVDTTATLGFSTTVGGVISEAWIVVVWGQGKLLLMRFFEDCSGVYKSCMPVQCDKGLLLEVIQTPGEEIINALVNVVSH
ncbi:hypothetical protein SARC_08631 [Sphaeroforma arctica JP610]|uniref:Uncharacterized protein n=1 Tax=Sphaeroforma arctica JP610 TaxID=667725 RepID=A0A0L0FSK1_9EUKA|nr:hypothetical protein SARC_08631 [Sphaeroforma arctica JP610]KNC78953.1 hypothetical protein SARC_08631 [Sphaeroforma arctica JP610]|eukprot:XP_014152855.1 hypothetical protein SARC_08631 [Sphaeroforma arctica JP610]